MLDWVRSQVKAAGVFWVMLLWVGSMIRSVVAPNFLHQLADLVAVSCVRRGRPHLYYGDVGPTLTPHPHP